MAVVSVNRVFINGTIRVESAEYAYVKDKSLVEAYDPSSTRQSNIHFDSLDDVKTCMKFEQPFTNGVIKIGDYLSLCIKSWYEHTKASVNSWLILEVSKQQHSSIPPLSLSQSQ